MGEKRRRETADEFNSLPIAPAARFLGVSRQTLYTWIQEGRLEARRLGARQRILRADLERLRRLRRRGSDDT